MPMSDFRDMIERDDFQPYVIKTRGGRRYTITDRSNAFIAEAYPSTVVVCVRGRGVTLLSLDAIESIQFEHDVAAAAT